MPRIYRYFILLILFCLLTAFNMGCKPVDELLPEETPSEIGQSTATAEIQTTVEQSAVENETGSGPFSITAENVDFMMETNRLLHHATALSFSHDSTLLAVGTLDDGVYLYPTANLVEPIHLPVTGIVRGVTFAPDDLSKMAVLSWDTQENNSILSLWDIESTAMVNSAELSLSTFVSDDPMELDLLPGILLPMTGTQPGYLVSDIHTSRLSQNKMIRLDEALNTLYSTELPLYGIASCPAVFDHQVLYGGKIYDLDTGDLVSALASFQERIACMSGSDDLIVFSTDGDHFVHEAIYEQDQIAGLQTLSGASDDVLSLALNPAKDILAASARNHQLLLWNVNTGDLVRTLTGTYHADFSPDGSMLAAIHADMQMGSLAPWSVRIYQVPIIPENYQSQEVVAQEQSAIEQEMTPTIQPAVEPTPIPTTVASYYACSDSMPSNLVSRMSAYIAPNVLGVRVRTSPGINQELVTSFSPNDRIQILDGPVCADGYVWWLVQRETDQVQGWAAEGGDQVYWILPCTPETCP